MWLCTSIEHLSKLNILNIHRFESHPDNVFSYRNCCFPHWLSKYNSTRSVMIKQILCPPVYPIGSNNCWPSLMKKYVSSKSNLFESILWKLAESWIPPKRDLLLHRRRTCWFHRHFFGACCIYMLYLSFHLSLYIYLVILISRICLHICLCIFISSYLYRIFVYTFVFCIWVILRCWGNSSILCQQNSDAL